MTSTRLQSAPKGATAPQALSMKLLSSALLVALAGVSAPVLAIDDDPGTALLRTSFASPGARAAGMGGAFVGLADDSSAAFLNPAGILLLPKKEVTVELRHRNPDSPGFGTLAGVQSGADGGTDVSYASFALPVPDKNFGLGFFYGQLSSAEFNARLNQTSLPGGALVGPGRSEVSLEDTFFGVAAALELHEGFRVGASVYRANRELTSLSVFETSAAQPPTNLATNFVYEGNTDGSDTGFNIGFHWTLNDAWSLGLAHRSAVEFDGTHRVASVVGSEVLPTTAVALDSGTTVIPSATTLGIGWRATERVSLALDIARVRHSQIIGDADFVGDEGTFLLTEPGDLATDDSTDIRLGCEFLIPGDSGSWFLRGGLAREGSSAIRATSAASSTVVPFFPGRDDENHITLGIGYAGESFGIDAAIDSSDSNKEFVASFVIMFD